MRIWEVWVCVMTAAVLGVLGGSSLESADLAWLLVQESPSSQPQAGAQVSVRRITPKSVFLAPTFTSCSEGYRQDSLGRCVKVVKVNPSAQWDFFLHKLNSMYGPPEPNSKPNPGPFRLPIPLVTELPTAATTTTTTELPTVSTVTEQSTTVLPTTTEDQATDPPFLIVVANSTEPPTTTTAVTEQPSTTTTQSTTNTEPTSESTTVCDDCDSSTTLTITTATPPVSPSRTTIVFPEDNRKRPSSSLVRFPESQQQSPYWWPHSWEHRLWQPPPAYYPPRQTVYHGRREARPAWQN